jgi:single-strand DNA-binding protein
MNETTMTMAGNLVADPELRYTPTGVAVVSFRIASTERYKNADGQWQDGDSLFMTCTAWRSLAENVAEAGRKGTRVIVTGRVKQRSYDIREGGRATVYGLEAADVGISLQRTMVRPSPAARQGDGGGAPADGETEAGLCIRCGERHDRYGPNGRPCSQILQ